LNLYAIRGLSNVVVVGDRQDLIDFVNYFVNYNLWLCHCFL